MPYYSIEILSSGVSIVRKAIRQPCITIVKNTGIQSSPIVEQIIANVLASFGYDALKGKFTDLMKAGIVDPTKVR